MGYYSRAHYRRVSPPADTPADVAARQRHHGALDQARADVAAKFPGGITPENAGAVLDYQQERIRFRIVEAERAAGSKGW